MAEIKINLLINVSPEKVFEAITEEKHVKKWWTPDTKLGDEKGRFEFNPYGDFVIVDVLKSEPEKLVEWEVTDSQMLKTKDWIGTRIKFGLSESEGKTNLNFSHENWEEETECFKECTKGWGYFLNSLKSYLETGKGTPFEAKEN
jgi:uncharacterized protein YndB with AHSA1/START domain